jgi:hypothetical protein
MSEENGHWIRDTVIAVVILAIVGWLATYIPGVWSWMKATSSWFLSWFVFSKVPVPVWLLALLLIAAALVVVRFAASLFNPRSSSGSNWLEYKNDLFHGVRWRWTFGASGMILNLSCFCPHDDTALAHTERFDGRTSFKCGKCGATFGPIRGDREHVMAMIERQIDRKLRNDEWKKRTPTVAP